MPKPKKYNPNKLANRPQRFIFELRIWDETTTSGHIDACEVFAFPVDDRNLAQASLYAGNFSMAAWAFIISDVVPTETKETSERLAKLLDDDGIAFLVEIRDRLKGPCFGRLIRRGVPGIAPQWVSDYCTVQDGKYRIHNAVDAVDRAISFNS
jgi:hypothetical protein